MGFIYIHRKTPKGFLNCQITAKKIDKPGHWTRGKQGHEFLMKETTVNKDSLFAFVCQLNSSSWVGQILSFVNKFYLLFNIINNRQEHIKNYLYLLTIFLILMKGKVHSSFYKLSKYA